MTSTGAQDNRIGSGRARIHVARRNEIRAHRFRISARIQAWRLKRGTIDNRMGDSKPTTIWRELLRRKVIRTGLSYSITAWLLMQVFDVILPAFEAPGWVFKVLIAILVAGLPIAMILAWSFEITPERSATARKRPVGVNGYLVIVLVIAISYLLFDKFYLSHGPDPGGAIVQATASSNKSIAVLPFKNLSANQEDLYFSDGVMEAILNELSLIRDLKVISRTSVEGYRDTTKPVTQIGQELDVAHVLEGSVQRAGDKVRVTAQLIATDNDKHLWSRNYDRSLSDIFAIQSEIAQAISSNLELILTHSERQMMINAPTSELRAYDLYLQARHNSSLGYFADRDVDEVRESLRNCQRAVELDPEFALAYTCLGNSYLELGVSDFVALEEWLPLATANVEKAIELDPDVWQAYDVLARISFSLGKFDETRRYSRKVLEINPNQADYLANVGRDLIWQYDELERGVDMVLRSLELMPGSSVSFDAEDLISTLQYLAPDLVEGLLGTDECLRDQGLISLNTIATWAMFERDYDTYLHCQELILDKNNTPNNKINAGVANLFAGNFDRARKYYEEVIAREESPDQSFTKWPYKQRYAVTLIETGERDRGLALLDEYRETLENAIGSDQQLHGNKGAYYDLATIYAVQGEKQAAVDMLLQARERAADGVFFDHSWLVADTMLDPLRDFPPFMELMEQLRRHDNADIEAARSYFRQELAKRQAEGRLLWLTAAKPGGNH